MSFKTNAAFKSDNKLCAFLIKFSFLYNFLTLELCTPSFRISTNSLLQSAFSR